jgi:hypothetical protein
VAAYPSYVSATQINAVLPSGTPTGTGTLTVTYNGATSATFPITVVTSSFGTFAFNEVGSGPGIFTNAVNYQLLTPFNTVKPGGYVTIWGTGLGPAPDISTEATAAPPLTNLCPTASSCPVTVWVGGQQATVLYAGRSGFTAEDQIDFQCRRASKAVTCRWPWRSPGLRGRQLHQPARGSHRRRLARMPTASITPTSHPLVQSKGHANIGDMILLSNYLELVDTDIGHQPLNSTTTRVRRARHLHLGALDAFEGLTLVPSVNNCTVSPFLQFPPPSDPALAGLPFLNAGTSLKYTGAERNCFRAD